MECSKCNVVNYQLWRPGGRNDILLCYSHLREKDISNPSDIKLGLLNGEWVEFFPAILLDGEKDKFYPYSITPKDKYTEWKQSKNYLRI